MFDAMNMLDAISTKTIVKCFRKSGVSSSSQKMPLTDGNDPFKKLNKELSRLKIVLKARFETKQKYR